MGYGLAGKWNAIRNNRSRLPTDEYRDGWDRIFGKTSAEPEQQQETASITGSAEQKKTKRDRSGGRE